MQIQLDPLIGILVSLILIGFFQGLEIAFISANRLNIELRKKQGKKSAASLSFFIEHPSKFIGTNIVISNLLIVIYGLFFAKFLNQFWAKTPLNNYAILAFDVLIAALILLIVVFLFKAIFKANNDTIINNSFIVSILKSTSRTFGTIASLFTKLSEVILNVALDKKFRNTSATISKVDLEQFIDQSKEHDTTEQEFDTELFENALSLADIKIRQCLIPRKEIVSIPNTATIQQVKEKFIETKLSKLIVYKENIDTIIGYVHQLDMFKKAQSINEILLPISAVPESMSASDLINKFNKDRKSIAWVVDEFGGTAGIVSLEDLLEELFGDIQDEYDTADLVEKQIAKDEFIFSGRLEIDKLVEQYHFDFPDNESETLSGYIIQAHETIPKQRERIIIGKYEIEILNVSETRIEMVKLRVLKNI